jgi:hypothetical protein
VPQDAAACAKLIVALVLVALAGVTDGSVPLGAAAAGHDGDYRLTYHFQPPSKAGFIRHGTKKGYQPPISWLSRCAP